MTRTFATLFPRLVPVAFNKGVGRLAYHFARDLRWRSMLAYCELEEAPAAPWFTEHVDVHRLGLVDLHDRKRQLARMARFVGRHARQIDVLNLYDIRWESFILAGLYKALNPRGVVFIKTDMDQRAVDMLNAGGRSVELYKRAIRHSAVDFFTVETSHIERQVRPLFERLGKPLHLVPIGFDPPADFDLATTFSAKEKIVISVGRTGSPQKHNELLLDAVAALPEELVSDWTFVWIGDDELGFRPRAEEVLTKHPRLRDHVRFVEHVSDRDTLLEWYQRASVFALSSRWESFATVLAEVPYFGATPVVTEVGAAMDITNAGEIGFVVPPEDLEAFTHALHSAMTLTSDEARTIANAAHARIGECFTWTGIVHELETLAGQV